MKKIFTVILMLMFVSLNVAAQTITDVNEGDPAPFTGTLLDPEAVAQILARQEAAVDLCALQLRNSADRAALACARRTDLLQVDLDLLNERYVESMAIKDDHIAELTSIIEDASSGPSGAVLVILGVAGGIGLTVGITLVVR